MWHWQIWIFRIHNSKGREWQAWLDFHENSYHFMALVVKNLPTNAGDIKGAGLIPGLGRSSGGGNGNPFQCSCLGNPMNRGAWGHKVSDTTERLTQSGKEGSSYRTRPPPSFFLSFFYFLSSSNMYWSLLQMRHCLELGIQYREEQDYATSALLKLIVYRGRHP